MAFFVNHMAFLLLLAAIVLSCQARESMFFSKAVRYTSPKDTAATATDNKETPAPLKNSEHGYGLYGRGPDELTTTSAAAATTTTTTGYNSNNGEVRSNFANNEFAPESYAATATANYKETPAPLNKEEPSATSFTPESSEHGYGLYGRGPDELTTTSAAATTSTASYNSNNGGARWNNKFARESYGDNNAGFGKPSSYINGNYEGNNMYPNNYNSGYMGKQQGMSDTRFQENGRYFYDVNAEEGSSDGYDPLSDNSDQLYQNFNGGTSSINGGGGYGGNGNGYKYSNNEGINKENVGSFGP